jgi:hypothetical protein
MFEFERNPGARSTIARVGNKNPAEWFAMVTRLGGFNQ